MTGDSPGAPGALAGLHSAFMAKMLTPDRMFDELTTACNALTASGANVSANNKAKTDLVLFTTTAQGGKTCEACDGCGVAETTARSTFGRYPEDRTRSYDRRDDRGHDYDARGKSSGRGRGRGSSNSDWRRGGPGRPRRRAQRRGIPTRRPRTQLRRTQQGWWTRQRPRQLQRRVASQRGWPRRRAQRTRRPRRVFANRRHSVRLARRIRRGGLVVGVGGLIGRIYCPGPSCGSNCISANIR